MRDESQDQVQRLIDNRRTMLGYDARAHCEAHGIDEQTARPSFMELAFVGVAGKVVLEYLQRLDREEVRDRV